MNLLVWILTIGFVCNILMLVFLGIADKLKRSSIQIVSYDSCEECDEIWLDKQNKEKEQ